MQIEKLFTYRVYKDSYKDPNLTIIFVADFNENRIGTWLATVLDKQNIFSRLVINSATRELPFTLSKIDYWFDSYNMLLCLFGSPTHTPSHSIASELLSSTESGSSTRVTKEK